MSVIVLVADGLRVDTLDRAIEGGKVPALARLRDEGALTAVTSVFPSVTGPAYTPFLLGRFPGSVGLPGLRWYDRTRKLPRMPGHSRSYVGPEMRFVDSDLDPAAPTLFELVPSSLAAMNVIGRGLRRTERIGHGIRFIVRTGLTHFRGDVRGWLAIDRDIAERFAKGIAESNPAFSFAALTGIDKTSHASGHDSALTAEALEIVDQTVAVIRADSERTNRWDDTHLWVVSDHGHSPVSRHEDLAQLVRECGFATISHPWAARFSPEVAVMVSGNAMAHIYVGLRHRHQTESQREVIRSLLLSRASVDLVLIPGEGQCEIQGAERGRALLTTHNHSLSYEPLSGDPLGIGAHRHISADQAYDITRNTEYPDALVQISHLAQSSRTGDVIVSAAPGWDFRARYEPIPHVSTHGSLRREHMLVPLLTNRPPRISPRRTTDVMPSVLVALGLPVPRELDGVSFL